MDVWVSHIEPELREALARRDAYTAVHCDRVGVLAGALARTLGLSADQLKILGMAARLHDIGKIGIPDSILLKPGPLDAAEWVVMRSHSERGERIVLADSGLPRRVELASIIRHHHEHYDGGGYPDGLRAQAIPLLSRLLAIADSYDAMTEPRSYHRARPHREVMEILMDERGNKHDPQMVDLMLSLPEAWFARLDPPQ